MTNAVLFNLMSDIIRFFALVMLVKYSFFIIIAPWHHVKEALRQRKIRRLGGQVYRPLVSVLIPAWNEEVGILSTIKSVLANSYPSIEVVVVNDGSTDATEAKIKNFLKSRQYAKWQAAGKRVRYYAQPNSGKGKALNQAITKSKGEIIITMDADSVADGAMVGNIVRYFADPTVDAAVGNVKVAGRLTFLNLLQRLEYLLGFYNKKAHSLLNAEYIYGGACAVFRRSTFEQIGLFDDSSITEDIEMSLRTKEQGLRSVYADDAICYTEGASSIMGLLKQRLRWKKGRVEAFIKYRRLFLSTNIKHNKWLTWVILPLSALSDLQLLFEPLGVALLFSYSLLTSDYSSIASGILFVSLLYITVGLTTERGRNLWLILAWPFTWAIFYFLVWIEYVALLKTIATTIRVEGVVWQRWQRKGIAIGDNK